MFPNPPTSTAADLIANENNAMPFDPTLFSNGRDHPRRDSDAGELRRRYQLRENGRDDISNQNRQATGGPGGS